MRNWLASIGFLSAIFGAANVHANLIRNGGFESGDFRNWTINFNGSQFSSASVSPASTLGMSGAYAASLFPSGAVLDLSQNVHTGPGVEYLISFEVESFGLVGSPGPNGGHVTTGPPFCDIVSDPSCNVLTVNFGSQIYQLANFISGPTPIDVSLMTGVTTRNTILNFEFYNSIYAIDNIVVTPCNSAKCISEHPSGINFEGIRVAEVPEPSESSLILFGLFGIFVLRRSFVSGNARVHREN